MRDALGPPLRAAAWTAFLAAMLLFFLRPPDLGGISSLLTIIAGGVAIAIVTAWITVRLIGEEMPEPQFRKLVDRSELLAMLPPPTRPPSHFDELVIEAIDDLPPEFQRLLETTPVVVADFGAEVHAYGHYIGGSVAADHLPNRIVIYEDTITRDFGHDPILLKAQVERVVRHELAHHLGWGEQGVRELGL